MQGLTSAIWADPRPEPSSLVSEWEALDACIVDSTLSLEDLDEIIGLGVVVLERANQIERAMALLERLRGRTEYASHNPIVRGFREAQLGRLLILAGRPSEGIQVWLQAVSGLVKGDSATASLISVQTLELIEGGTLDPRDIRLRDLVQALQACISSKSFPHILGLAELSRHVVTGLRSDTEK